MAPVRLRHDVYKAGGVGTSTQEVLDSQQWAEMEKMDFDELVRLLFAVVLAQKSRSFPVLTSPS